MLTSIRRLYTSRSLTCLFGLALFTYNSWPLGFILNPSIVKIGLASVLEAANQPGRWVFIGLDIASSVLVMFAVVRLLWQSQKIHQGLKVVVSGWLLFSLGTCFDALLPLNCHQSIRRCGLGTQVIGLHDVLGRCFSVIDRNRLVVSSSTKL
jgi:urea transporter